VNDHILLISNNKLVKIRFGQCVLGTSPSLDCFSILPKLTSPKFAEAGVDFSLGSGENMSVFGQLARRISTFRFNSFRLCCIFAPAALWGAALVCVASVSTIPVARAGTVTITAPANGTSVTSPVTVAAGADLTTCNSGFNHLQALMNGVVSYNTSANCSFSAPVAVPSGSDSINVQAIAWDGALMAQATISVTASPGSQTCSLTISSGESISGGASAAPNNGTLCVNSGNYLLTRSVVIT